MENFLHVYTGDGKGKTTAAIGLALRYLGHGGSVMLIQFMKGSSSGEILLLEKAGATIHRLSKDFGFYPFTDKEKVIKEHQAMLTIAKNFSTQKSGLLILDECISAYYLSLVDRCDLLALY